MIRQIAIGIGSNQGDRKDSIRKALRLLPFEIQSISSIFESDALLPEGAPLHWDQPFFNLVVLARTALSPIECLESLKKLEVKIGRVERERWAPRVIDLDLLWCEGVQMTTTRLTLPHPGIVDRPFVLLPFAQVAPHLVIGDLSFKNSHNAKTLRDLARKYAHLDPGEVPFRTRRTSESLIKIVGVLNATPDSFSHTSGDQGLAKIRSLLSSGIDVIDIGGESTRPGAVAVSESEEWARISPVIETIQDELRLQTSEGSLTKVKISIDTRHSKVAERALELGVDWINDVAGLRDSEMARLASHSSAKWVVMHSLSVPPLPDETIAPSKCPIETIGNWVMSTLKKLEQKGIALDRVIFDPGIGFGKTPEQNLEIISRMSELRWLRVEWLLGYSRKSFMAKFSKVPASDRGLETSLISSRLAAQGFDGIDYLRVHDVEMNSRAIAYGAYQGPL